MGLRSNCGAENQGKEVLHEMQEAFPDMDTVRG